MNLNDLPDMSDALKQVQMYEAKKKGDGNLANNAVPYDKVTRADIITGALGKDEEGGKKKPKGHDCAKLVKYKKEEFEVIPEQHTLLEDGTVTHYDITDGEWIYENVPVEELEILISEKHEHFANYDKNAEVLGEGEKPLPKNKMFRKMGNLGRDIVSKHTSDEDRQKKYDRQKKMTRVFNKANEEVEQVDENRAAARAAGGYKDDSKKQPDPSKAGFTGIGNMSIDQIRKMSARIEKEKAKKEAFAFSEEDFEELDLFGEEIDAMTDEELIDMMEELIIETAEDDQDLIEICEHLEGIEVLSEDYYASAVKASKEAAKKPEVKAANRRARVERLKSAAKGAAERVGSAAKAGAKMVKKGVKAAGKSVVSTAGKVAGTYQGEKEAARIKAKRASMERTPAKKKEASKSSDDDGTGGKLDALLKSTRGTSSSSDSGSKSGGGGESSSSGPGLLKKKKGPGLLRRAAGAVGRGLKKAVGKTARAVSSGSDKLAKRLGENYEQIAHLYESGLFTIEEIENVIEEGFKPYPAEKVARKREAVKKKEDIATYQRRDADANKLYKRGVAMSFKKKMKDVGGN